MWENTWLVFSADNGGYLRQGGDNTPLRGGKFSDFEALNSPHGPTSALVPLLSIYDISL